MRGNPEKRRRRWRRNADIRFNILIALRGRINRIKLMFHGVWNRGWGGCTPLKRSLRPAIDIYIYICTTVHLQDATSTFSLNELFLSRRRRRRKIRAQFERDFSTRFCYVFRRRGWMKLGAWTSFFRRFLTRHGIGNHAFRSTYKNKVGWKFVFSRNWAMIGIF